MSNAPDPRWSPPPPYSVPHAAPPNPASKVGWRIRHSWWLILPILGLGCLGGAGFLYIGFRAKRPAWWIPGIVYMVLGWASFAIVGETPEEGSAGSWAVGLFMAVWVASIVHACLVNSSWLQWRAHYLPWHAEPSAPPPVWQTPTPFAAGLPPAYPGPAVAYPGPAAVYPGPAASGYPGPAAVGYAGPAVSSAVGSFPAGAVVDVNTAAAEDFARLPGFDLDRAHRVIAERQLRSRFASVDEFAFAAGLAPHQFAPLRAHLTCSTPPAPPLWQPPDGRVLDV